MASAPKGRKPGKAAKPWDVQSFARRLEQLEYAEFSADGAITRLAIEFQACTEAIGQFVAKHADELVTAVEQARARRKLRRKASRERSRQKPDARLNASVRAHVWYAVKRGSGRKPNSTFAMLGYTPADLRKHLMGLLRDGMTMQNYGRVWHVDHKRPVSSFDFSGASQSLEATIKECWALSNLQPLFASENISKGARLICQN